jgi:hypothetical protein
MARKTKSDRSGVFAGRGVGAWVRQGLAAIVVLAIVVAVGVIVRAEDAWHAECSYADYDCSSGLVCTMRPGLDRVFDSLGRHPFHARTNAAGFRGAEWPEGAYPPRRLRGAVAYAPQEAWVQAASVRDNVLLRATAAGAGSGMLNPLIARPADPRRPAPSAASAVASNARRRS